MPIPGHSRMGMPVMLVRVSSPSLRAGGGGEGNGTNFLFNILFWSPRASLTIAVPQRYTIAS